MKVFLAFLQKLKETNPEAEAFLNKLEKLGIDGSRGSQVFLALSNNIEKVRERQALANKEVEKGTSITNEYNKRNNNLAANLEKIGKVISKAFTNSGFVSALEGVANWGAKIVAVKLSDEIEKEIVQLNAMTVALKTSNTSEDERHKIIERIQSIYPGFLSNIDAEKVSNEELDAALKNLNQSLVNKLVLQKEDEKIAEQQQKQADLAAKNIDYELKLREKLGELIRRNDQLQLDDQKSLQQNAAAMLSQLNAEDNAHRRNIAILKKDLGLRREIVQILTNQESIQAQLTSAESKTSEMITRRDAVMKELGITMEDANAVMAKGVLDSSDYRGEIEKQKTALEELRKQLKENEDARTSLASLEMNGQEKARLTRLKSEGVAIKTQITFLEELISIEEKKMTAEQKRIAELKKSMAAEIQNGIVPLAKIEQTISEYKTQMRKALDEEAKQIEDDYINGIINYEEYLKALQALDKVYMQHDQAAWDQHLRDQINSREQLAGGASPNNPGQSLVAWWNDNNATVTTVYADMAAAYSSYLDIMANLDQRRINDIERKYNFEQTTLDKMLKSKTISQEAYDYQKQKSEEKRRKKEAAIKTQQFKRDKRFAIVQAGINTALAATKALAQGGYPLGLVLAGFAIAAGAIQIAAIASQPTPQFEKGGVLNGPSHKSGGMPIVNPNTGRKEAEVEGGEILMTKGVSKDPYLAAAASALNVAGGGDPLFPKYTAPRNQRYFADGGTLPSIDGSASSSGTDTLISEMKALRKEFQNFPRQLRADVSIDQIDSARAEKYKADSLS